ncbi:predicted protein [Nematostella vectensis]|uniref:Small ribosomal subunit protein mS35 mitochondrial conserved domain-containing protein n=1 Tax=Nematostella vectensis TaxID=45351 RepID=A7T1L7_NEMVE|nr:predicted protein [Nematostella vectensis]|eukprot:XP_001622247.1 predicted protein [Nematostella vectensis]
MAAMSSGKIGSTKFPFLRSISRVTLLKKCLIDNLPCSSYASQAGKAASQMMKREDGPRLGSRGRGGRTRVGTTILKNPSRAVTMKPESTDWPSVFSGPQTYNPAIIPVFLRMGRRKHNRLDNFPQRTMANLELMKIPNFFHLSPPAIERHCQALKPLCKPWPKDLDPSLRPLRVITRNYLFAGPSLHHPGSKKVKLQVFLKDLILDDHARTKLIELVGERYNPVDDSLTIVTDRCPTRQQNNDYALYLMTVLYNEAWKIEPWETEASNEICDDESDEPIRKRRNAIRLRLVGDELYRFNKYGKGFKLHVKVKV